MQRRKVQASRAEELPSCNFRPWVGSLSSRIFVPIFGLVHLTAFAYGLSYHDAHEGFITARPTLGMSFPIARAASFVMRVDLAVLIIPTCRRLVSVIRRRILHNSIDLANVIFVHKLASSSLVIFAYLHSVAYTYSLAKHAVEQENGESTRLFLANNFTATLGHLMFISISVIAVTSLERIRQINYGVSWSVHHLYIVFPLL